MFDVAQHMPSICIPWAAAVSRVGAWATTAFTHFAHTACEAHCFCFVVSSYKSSTENASAANRTRGTISNVITSFHIENIIN